MWPVPSPGAALAARRAAFLKRLKTPAALASGLRRVRNFEHNPFPFRADSHFLYFTGVHLEGAVLHFDGGECTLYVDPPDPAGRLWHGHEPSLAELERRLELSVRPLEDFEPTPECAAIASPDSDSALWLEDLMGRTLELDAELVRVARSELDPEEHADELLARALVEQRLHHDEAALEQMRQAARVTVQAHRDGVARLAHAERATWVKAHIEATFTKWGMTPAYGSIVTPRGDILHARDSNDRLTAKDWLLVDAGAETPEGWASDVTRTWPVDGTFKGLGKDLYKAVLDAQQAAIYACKPGVRFLDLHRLATRELTSALVAANILKGDVDDLVEQGVSATLFPHGLGHLLGLDVHDMEDLGDRAGYPEGRARGTEGAERLLRLDRVLEPGMVVTIEPGVYNILSLLDEGPQLDAAKKALVPLNEFLEFTGIRIEDDVLITETGCEVLTRDLAKTPEDVTELLRG